jgi:hypothetical protein
LIGVDIDYVRRCSERDRAVVVLPAQDPNESVRTLVDLAHRPQALAELSRAALAAARVHSADAWYRRRAEWTFEAFDMHQRAGRA